MVNKNIIKKIIHEAYTKCSNNHIPSNSYSWGARLPLKVKQAIQQFKQKYCTLGKQSKIEHLEIYDDQGNTVYDKDGDNESVEWSILITSDIRKDTDKELNMVHNHPNGFFGIPVCFSKADINSFLQKSTIDKDQFLFKTSSVVSANGSRMTITKNNKFTDDNIQNCNTTYDKLSMVYEKYLSDVHKTLMKIKTNTIDTDNIPNNNNLTESQNIELFLMHQAIEEVGTFESRLKGIREEFNKANIEFSIEWEGETY